MRSSYDVLGFSPVTDAIDETSHDTLSKSSKQLAQTGSKGPFGDPNPLCSYKHNLNTNITADLGMKRNQTIPLL